MQCRACWSDRAYVCRAPRWKVWAAACVLAAPVKCHHCFHRFLVPIWSQGVGLPDRSATVAGSADSGASRRDFAPRKAA